MLISFHVLNFLFPPVFHPYRALSAKTIHPAHMNSLAIIKTTEENKLLNILCYSSTNELPSPS